MSIETRIDFTSSQDIEQHLNQPKYHKLQHNTFICLPCFHFRKLDFLCILIIIHALPFRNKLFTNMLKCSCVKNEKKNHITITHNIQFYDGWKNISYDDNFHLQRFFYVLPTHIFISFQFRIQKQQACTFCMAFESGS